ncbi:MAG: helix-turn-helix domain-containing protein [Verrucomicrobiota bacterium]
MKNNTPNPPEPSKPNKTLKSFSASQMRDGQLETALQKLQENYREFSELLRTISSASRDFTNEIVKIRCLLESLESKITAARSRVDHKEGFPLPSPPARTTVLRLLKREELAPILGISPRLVHTLTRAKLIPSIRLGRCVRFNLDQVMAAIDRDLTIRARCR